MIPWTQRYAPKHTEDVIGNTDAASKAKRLAMHHETGDKAIWLHGPHGTGKTATVYAIAEELDYEVVEINASDTRKKKTVNTLLNSVIGQQSLLSQGKIVLIDEVEGLSGRSDRGGATAVKNIIEASPYPVFITGIDPEERKLKKLKKRSILIEYRSISYKDIYEALQRILSEEHIEYDDRDLKQLSRVAGGDLRAAINDTQGNIVNDAFVYDPTQAASRDVDVEIRNALLRIFKTTNPDVARGSYRNVQENLDDIFLWVDANLSRAYKDTEALAKAYDTFSYADVLKGRIFRRQYYRFYAYIYDLLSVGISLAKKETLRGTPKFKEPRKRLTIWISNRKNKKRDDVAQSLAEYLHISEKEAVRNVLPFFKRLAKTDEDWAEWLGNELELEKKEKKWLAS